MPFLLGTFHYGFLNFQGLLRQPFVGLARFWAIKSCAIHIHTAYPGKNNRTNSSILGLLFLRGSTPMKGVTDSLWTKEDQHFSKPIRIPNMSRPLQELTVLATVYFLSSLGDPVGLDKIAV